MIVHDCLGTATSEAEQISSACVEIAGTVLLLTLSSAPADSYDDWVTAGVIATLEKLQALQRLSSQELKDANPVTVVCVGVPAVAELAAPAEALFEAARGVVQSVTLEDATAQVLRCNVLRVARVSDKQVTAVLRYLASGDGGFAMGSTLDLVGGHR